MFTSLYLFAILPLVFGLLYLWAVVRMWRTDQTLAIVMFFFVPAGVYALFKYWNEEQDNIRLPMIGALIAGLAWGGMAWQAHRYAEAHPEELAEGEAAIERIQAHIAQRDGAAQSAADNQERQRLKQSLAIAQLPFRVGRIELPELHATLDVPAHFRFVSVEALRPVFDGSDLEPDPGSLGWLVHETVDLATADPWYVEVIGHRKGYIPSDSPLPSAAALLTRAQAVVEAIAGKEGLDADEVGKVVGYAEAPVWDAASQRITWAQEYMPADSDASELVCNAAALGRTGAVEFVMFAGPSRNELCVRSVRLAAARTAFESGHRYAERGLFDKKAGYDLAGLVSGEYQLR